ncbi:hypothetical protein [Sphingomonas sp.]
MTANIIRIPNPEHEARCVAAIRRRRANEATFWVAPRKQEKAA